MKKRLTTNNETSTRPSLRRQTRSSVSTKSISESVTESISCNEVKGQRIHKKQKAKQRALLNEQESPPKISPEITLHCKQLKSKVQQDSVGTPTPNKNFTVKERTPFKDDFLLASQGDPQSDVRWDCTSPDAFRFIRKNRKHRLSSDVADIVQLLIPEEEEEEDADSSRNTPPLLGLWMNSKNDGKQEPSDSTLNNGSKLVRFRRKDRCRSGASKDVKMPADLIEKLKLAVQRCDMEHVKSSGLNLENEGETRDGAKDDDFDQSKDLFASSEIKTVKSPQHKNNLNLDEGMSCFTEGGPSPGVSGHTDPQDSDLSWSDDDMFKDNAFLIKATQNTVLEEMSAKASSNSGDKKRKSNEDNRDGPRNKIGKFNSKEDSSSVKSSFAKDSCNILPSCSKNSSVVGETVESNSSLSQGRKIASPFRKVKSFNDIDCKMDTIESAKGQIGKSLPLKHNKTVNRSQSLVNMSGVCDKNPAVQFCHSKTQTESVPASRNNSLSCYGNTSNKSSNTAKSLNVVNCTGAKSKINVAVAQTSNTNVKPQNVVSNAAAINKNTSPVAQTTNTKTNTKPHNVVSSYTVPNNKNKNTFAQMTYTKELVKPIISASCTNTCVSSATKSPISNVTTVKCTTRRRSSGMFDTSLTDDLLCQLAEPDELLDSQVPLCSPTPSKTNVNNRAFVVKDNPTHTTAGQILPVATKSTSSMPCDKDKKGIVSSVYSSNIGTGKSTVKSVRQALGKTEDKSSSISQKKQRNTNPISDISKQNNSVANSNLGAKCLHNLHSNYSSENKQQDQASQLTSTQKNKFTFKSKAVSRQCTGSMDSKSSQLSKTTSLSTHLPLPNQSGSSVAVPSDPASVNNSEDLFMSDDDDELSEQQILAILDTVEMEASQMSSTQRNPPGTDRLQQQSKESTVKDAASYIQKSVACENKCSMDEIEKKKQMALQKLKKKNQEKTQTFPKTSATITQNETLRKQTAMEKIEHRSEKMLPESPTKIKQEDIIRKKQAALEKLKLKKETSYNNTSYTCDNEIKDSMSPSKCTQDEIERKRQAALERRKHSSGELRKVRHQSDSSPGMSSSQSADSSPFKCTPEEIEKKKQAALEKLKFKKNLCTQLSGK